MQSVISKELFTEYLGHVQETQDFQIKLNSVNQILPDEEDYYPDCDTYNTLKWLFYLTNSKKFDNSVLTNEKLRGKIIKYDQKTNKCSKKIH